MPETFMPHMAESYKKKEGTEMKSIAQTIFKELESYGKYPVRLFNNTQIFTQLYESHNNIHEPAPSPLEISSTCDIEKKLWIVNISNAPQITSNRIKSTISDKSPWLYSHTYTCEYKFFLGCRYLIFTIELDNEIRCDFLNKLNSMNEMLQSLFDLPTSKS